MNQHRVSFASLAFLLCASAAIACNVPVFRYALERWPADVYEVVVLHKGELSSADQQHLRSLRKSSGESVGVANFVVREIEVDKADPNNDSLFTKLWDEHRGDEPLMVAMYPRKAQDVPDPVVSTAPLNDQSVARLVDSPVRQQVVQKLLQGDSAVWIFVPCGNEQKDSRALQTLETQVRKNQDELELPPQDEIEADEFFLEETPIELRLGFSIVSLDREDPDEAFLLQMLIGSEPDLEELDEPMAFPVIGRGRVLYALVGKGIFRDTIAMASRFVVGPCSCQVKEQNPGFDLLLSVDWNDKLGGAVVSEPSEITKKPILIEIPPGK